MDYRYWKDDGVQYRAHVDYDLFVNDGPRHWDNLSHMVCKLDSYRLSDDVQPFKCDPDKVDGTDVILYISSGTEYEEQFEDMMERDEYDPDFLSEMMMETGYLIVPISAVNTYHDDVEIEQQGPHYWADYLREGGFMYCTRDEAKRYGIVGDNWRDEAKRQFSSELETMNLWTHGLMYQVAIEEQIIDRDMRTCEGVETWELVDSCGGILSDEYGDELFRVCLDGFGYYHGEPLSETPLDDSLASTAHISTPQIKKYIYDALRGNGYEPGAKEVAAVINDDDLCRYVTQRVDKDLKEAIDKAVYLMDEAMLRGGE